METPPRTNHREPRSIPANRTFKLTRSQEISLRRPTSLTLAFSPLPVVHLVDRWLTCPVSPLTQVILTAIVGSHSLKPFMQPPTPIPALIGFF